MFDRGLNWERRADGTILYRRTPSEPTFIIDERALGQILRFRFMIPLMSFLTLLPAVSLGPVARHGHVSFAVPVGAFLLGAAFFYAYFRSVERRIKRILAEARPSVQAPEPYKTPRDARGWKTLEDGTVTLLVAHHVKAGGYDRSTVCRHRQGERERVGGRPIELDRSRSDGWLPVGR
ncbi:hypothetical protein [Sinorhizobium fredii]|uniref:hypothetical protein n=1 Tax=Rhizobium fredii TaxID=380 RepID=UPI00130E7A4C|nr:hypothetical protein [Sinorhizobium fredii]WOS62992.1 hypothetical protein SFGR64A_00905 [Sinorhizobium fredii GR64]